MSTAYDSSILAGEGHSRVRAIYDAAMAKAALVERVRDSRGEWVYPEAAVWSPA